MDPSGSLSAQLISGHAFSPNFEGNVPQPCRLAKGDYKFSSSNALFKLNASSTSRRSGFEV
jgi:hypothetical protein